MTKNPTPEQIVGREKLDELRRAGYDVRPVVCSNPGKESNLGGGYRLVCRWPECKCLQ